MRPVPFHLREAKELLEQFKDGILERVESGPTIWVSNLVIIRKENGSVRLTCDSKALNKALRRTRYPSMCIEDLVVMVNGAIWFTILDLMKAFHHLLLHMGSRFYHVITTHLGLFRDLLLHMGGCCATKIFNEEIRKLLEGLQCQVNMTDDIMVWGLSKQEHHDCHMECEVCQKSMPTELHVEHLILQTTAIPTPRRYKRRDGP